MHEASLVAALLQQVQTLASAHCASRVAEIRLEVGLLAGVEPLLLSEAFQRLRAGTPAADARLIVEPSGLALRCGDCNQESVVNELCFLCPRCGGGDVAVIGGDAVMLQSIELIPCPEATAAP